MIPSKLHYWSASETHIGHLTTDPIVAENSQLDRSMRSDTGFISQTNYAIIILGRRWTEGIEVTSEVVQVIKRWNRYSPRETW